jgi:suppressor for copper-sensitivity B
MELRKTRSAFWALAVAVWVAVCAPAVKAEGWVAAASTPISARLIAAPSAVGTLSEIPAGVEVKLAAGWKTYWRSPGDAGLPPAISWKDSRNLAAADFDFPTPHRFSVLGIETIGYADHVVFPVKATPAQPGAPLGLRAELDLLVCADICVPEKFALSLDLPAGEAAPSPQAGLVARAFSAVPKDGPAAGVNLESVEAKGPAVRAVIAAAAPLTTPDLFIETEPYLAFSAPKVALLGGGRYEFHAAAVDAPKDLDLAGKKLRLTLADGEVGADFTAVAAAMSASPAAAASAVIAPSLPPAGLLSMLGVALLGGLILNLMPCVLPVLSLKLLSVAQYGGGERDWVRAGFLATAAGIVASFLMLAAATIGLKAAGAAVGWGVQFQQPVFLGFMMAVTALFAVNLAGWFEIPLPRFIADRMSGTEGRGLSGAFVTGVFATFLATPCSAPFLGTAVSFALAAGGVEILAIFTALGVGMASPYLLTAAFPGVAGVLPRPGRWMLTVRRVMAAAMLGTTVWLGTVLATQLGGAGDGGKDAATTNAAGVRWVAFDESAIPGLVAAGKVVVVDVTADWCVTCQVNKKLVLNRGATAQMLAGPNVVAMRADWTRPDEGIARYLARHGRYGIPFNIVYGPRAPQGVALPELLTESAVLAAAAQAGL